MVVLVVAVRNPFGTKKVAKAPQTSKKAPARKAPAQGTKKAWLGGESDFGDDLSRWYGPNRKTYLPGGLIGDVPSYMDGSLAGDYGYDPLNLGTDTETVAKYREAELIHARWAMLGTAGMIFPEGLAASGADIKGSTWFQTGKVLLEGDSLNYLIAPFKLVSNPLNLAACVLLQLVLVGAAEQYRATGEGPQGYAPGAGKFDSSVFDGVDSLNPGGPFDPLGLADDPDVFAELKVKEIKNGRLAMVAFLGYCVQGAVTGEGPYANWSKHIADPFGYNLTTVVGNTERLPSL